MPPKHDTTLRDHLDRVYDRYHRPEYLTLDPLSIVRRYASNAQSAEAAGLVAASFAYGRIELIIRHLDSVFAIAGSDLVGFIDQTSYREKQRSFAPLKYRFNDGTDIALLFHTMREMREKYGSLKKLFIESLPSGDTIRFALHNFVSTLKDTGRGIAGRRRGSFEFLLPSPEDGSACKRMNMYLRWMVRPDDGIDIGAWSDAVRPSALLMPVDAHIARAARALGLSRRNQADWKMSEEITAGLRRHAPDDPVKYDFSLCRAGMIELRQGGDNAVHQ